MAHVQTPDETPDPYPQPPSAPEEDDWLVEPQPRPARTFEQVWGWGQTLTWASGLVLAVSAFTDWYAGARDGPTTSVTGWHTGALGKLVFFTGLAELALVSLREAGIELPATVPESLVAGRARRPRDNLRADPADLVPDSSSRRRGRGIGIFISLLGVARVIAAGLLRAAEEL